MSGYNHSEGHLVELHLWRETEAEIATLDVVLVVVVVVAVAVEIVLEVVVAMEDEVAIVLSAYFEDSL